MEALAGILFLILIVVLSIVALWPVIELILHIGLLTLIVTGGASAILFLSLYVFSVLKTQYIKRKGKLSKFVEFEFDNQKLSWFIDEELVRASVNSADIYFLVSIVGIGSMVGLLIVLKNTGCFRIHLWQGGPFQITVSEQTSLNIVSIVSAIAFIIIMYKSNPKRIFEDWMLKQANELMSRVEKRVERIENLRSLETSIHSTASNMEATFPIDVQTEIQDFVSSHKMEILSDVTELNRFISKKIEQATEDLAELQNANDLYQTAMKLYTETVHGVNKTGSIPMIKELEYDYQGLTSTNLKDLVSNRKWNKFTEVVNSIMCDLERLSNLAIKYQEAGYESEVEYYGSENDEERAYRILGIPSTASPDQIKKVYRAISMVWHPDKKTVEDDTRMKEINWAYNFLKDLKNFT